MNILPLLALAVAVPQEASRDEAKKIIAKMEKQIGRGAIVEQIDKIFFVGTDGTQRSLDRCYRAMAFERLNPPIGRKTAGL